MYDENKQKLHEVINKIYVGNILILHFDIVKTETSGE